MVTSAVSVQFSAGRPFSSARRDRARRRADRNVRPTLITASPTSVLLESQLVVGVGERSALGPTCHARKEGEDHRERRSPERQMGKQDVTRNIALVQRSNPGNLVHFAGFAALGSGDPRSARNTVYTSGYWWYSVGVDSYLRCLDLSSE